MTRLVKVACVPLAVLSFHIASRYPELVDRWYGEHLYPRIVQGFGFINRAGFSLAELALVTLLVAAPLGAYLSIRDRRRSRREKMLRLASRAWVGTAGLLVCFLLLWGFNYARPSLAGRLDLSPSPAEAAEVLDVGRRVALRTRALYGKIDQASVPSRLPYGFQELDRLIDDGFRELALPGDTIDSTTTAAKPLRTSELFSHLGISGIFIPFTGEPSVNTLQPDVSLPMVLAHEKAHQRGIAHEGEASFAAFLVCSRPNAPAYLRYAAHLFATRYLIGEASYFLPADEVLAAWELLGSGPTEDLIAIRDFWKRYQGVASETAARVNDRYLRSFGVEEGIESYGTVVQLLVALDQRGELVSE